MKNTILLISAWILFGLSIIIGGSNGVAFGQEICEGFEGPVDISGEHTGDSWECSLVTCEEGTKWFQFGPSILTLELNATRTEGELVVLEYTGSIESHAGISQYLPIPSEGHEYGCYYMTLFDLGYTIEGDISWKFDTSTNRYRLDDNYFEAEVIPGTVPCGTGSVDATMQFLVHSCCDDICVTVGRVDFTSTGINFDGCTEFEYIQPDAPYEDRCIRTPLTIEEMVLDGTVLDIDVAPTGKIKGHLFSAVPVETTDGYEYADVDQATVDLYRQDAAVREKNDDETIEDYLEFLEEQGRALISSIELEPGDNGIFSFEEVTIYDTVNGSEKTHYLYMIEVSDARIEGTDPDDASITKTLYYASNARVNLTPEMEEPFTIHDIPLAPLESFVVNSTGDDSDADKDDKICATVNETAAGEPECTLRAATEQANSNEGSDVITFNIPGPGPHTIYPLSALPTITDPVTIDGTTQPSDVVTTGLGPTQNGTPINITINGSKAGRVNGRHYTAKTTVRGLRIINFKRAGIFLDKGSDGSSIEGNIIGIDQNGQKQGNKYGVLIHSSFNKIGWFAKSAGEGDGNVISGNTYGIYIQGKDAKGNGVYSNLIGTNKDESSKTGNDYGVYIENAPENVIGAVSLSYQSEGGNVISGNTYGIYIQGKDAKGNKVLGNLIGTNKDGSGKIGNKRSGVYIENAPENIIGGTRGSSGNIISGSGRYGILIKGKDAKGNKVLGNLIGTNKDGSSIISNYLGVAIYKAPENLIGNKNAFEGNVISGNDHGLQIQGKDAKGNRVLGNLIGLDLYGKNKLGNLYSGVRISSAPDNIIEENYISGNGGHGVKLRGRYAHNNKVRGNFIGQKKDSGGVAQNVGNGVRIEYFAGQNTIGGEEYSEGNKIVTKNESGVVLTRRAGAGNAILSNDIRIVEIESDDYWDWDLQTIGIDLNNDGVTPNHSNDPLRLFLFPNTSYNYPVLDSVKLEGWGDKLKIKGRLNSRPEKTYTIQFFEGKCDPEKGELSHNYLYSISVRTDDKGNAKIESESESDVFVGDFITATATDPDGNTSEFSGCVPVEEE